jgi:hypothetical protein
MFDSDNMHDKSNLDWSVFDAIYLINLRERTDRRRELEAELCSVGLLPGDPKLIWLNAVKPENIRRISQHWSVRVLSQSFGVPASGFGKQTYANIDYGG